MAILATNSLVTTLLSMQNVYWGNQVQTLLILLIFLILKRFSNVKLAGSRSTVPMIVQFELFIWTGDIAIRSPLWHSNFGGPSIENHPKLIDWMKVSY